MPLPPPIETLWTDLEAARKEVLKEAEGLSQGQADWRPRPGDWSVGEIVHHLTLAEVATGKLTSKLLREAGPAAAAFPADLRALTPLPALSGAAGDAPEAVRPAAPGQAIGTLLADMKDARQRTRQTLERLAAVDPRPLRWKHPRFGELDLGQWWLLQAFHDRDHLAQLRAVKADPGFPRG